MIWFLEHSLRKNVICESLKTLILFSKRQNFQCPFWPFMMVLWSPSFIIIHLFLFLFLLPFAMVVEVPSSAYSSLFSWSFYLINVGLLLGLLLILNKTGFLNLLEFLGCSWIYKDDIFFHNWEEEKFLVTKVSYKLIYLLLLLCLRIQKQQMDGRLGLETLIWDSEQHRIRSRQQHQNHTAAKCPRLVSLPSHPPILTLRWEVQFLNFRKFFSYLGFFLVFNFCSGLV